MKFDPKCWSTTIFTCCCEIIGGTINVTRWTYPISNIINNIDVNVPMDNDDYLSYNVMR